MVTWQKICAPSCCTVFTHWPHSAVVSVSLPHRSSVPSSPSASGRNGTKMQCDETHEATLTSVTKQDCGDGKDAEALIDSVKTSVKACYSNIHSYRHVSKALGQEQVHHGVTTAFSKHLGRKGNTGILSHFCPMYDFGPR